MDPNKNLQEQLRIAADILELIPEGEVNEGQSRMSLNELVTAAERLAELVEVMNGWLSKGGFLPGKWERK